MTTDCQSGSDVLDFDESTAVPGRSTCRSVIAEKGDDDDDDDDNDDDDDDDNDDDDDDDDDDDNDDDDDDDNDDDDDDDDGIAWSAGDEQLSRVMGVTPAPVSSCLVLSAPVSVPSPSTNRQR